MLRQSARSARMPRPLGRLAGLGLTRNCACSRSALAALPRIGTVPPGEELFHPPRAWRPWPPVAGTAVRLRVPDREIEFKDRSLGTCRINVARAGGDFVLRRRDGLFAYQLAVVVDDAAQGITDVVRGADLLASTPRQLLLQRRPRPAPTPVHAFATCRGRKGP